MLLPSRGLIVMESISSCAEHWNRHWVFLRCRARVSSSRVGSHRMTSHGRWPRTTEGEYAAMKNSLRFQFALVVVALTAQQASTFAHFKLLEPASWINSDQRGDPQKVGPCGGDPKGENEKLLTNAITKVTGGAKLHLKNPEKVFPSGHYPVALPGKSPTELPPEPVRRQKYNEKGR